MAELSPTAAADYARRRRLRLGALLFQLGYYMQDPGDVAAAIYRRGPSIYVQFMDGQVRLVNGTRVEVLPLEDAITRCKDALGGHPLHSS